MLYSELSDEDIITKFKATENENYKSDLLSTLVKRHQDAVIRRCLFYLKDREEAQDISQEVWVRVLTRFHQFRDEERFTPWLFSIAHNRCHDHIYKDKRKFYRG